MAQTAALAPFFERSADSRDGFPADSYVAGFREADGETADIRITLPADIVDRTVLTGAQLSIWLRALDGKLILDGEGLGDETLEAALTAGPLRQLTLRTLVEACVERRHLVLETDPIGDLTSLRSQLVDVLALVDSALDGLRADG